MIRLGSHRRGMSLVELMVAMTIASILLGITTTWLTRVFRVHRQTQNTLNWQQALLRLDRDIRDDIRVAETLAVEGGSLVVQFDDSQRVARYDMERGNVHRTTTVEDDVTRRERYPVPPDSVFECDVSTDSATVTIRQTHAFSADDKGLSSRTLFRCIHTLRTARSSATDIDPSSIEGQSE